MTKEEIDSWIEQHIVCSKEDICIPVDLKSLSENLIAWAKMVANKFYNIGYKQAEKDTIERAIAWLEKHANNYIVDLTQTYPDAPQQLIIGGMCWEHLKKAMEEQG